MNPQELVSVVVPTYNRADYLSETLQSIRQQSFQNFEILVVDNMSSDDTEKRVAEMEDSRIRFFKNPNHGVIAVSRNYGIREARGEYIAFCDDDDLWLPNKLEIQTRLLKENPSADLVHSPDIHILSPDGNKRLKKRKAIESFQQLMFFSKITTSSVMVKKSCLKNVGLFDEDPLLCTCEDKDLWLRIAATGSKLIGSKEPLIVWRAHPKNRMAKFSNKSINKSYYLHSKLILKLGLDKKNHTFFWMAVLLKALRALFVNGSKDPKAGDKALKEKSATQGSKPQELSC